MAALETGFMCGCFHGDWLLVWCNNQDRPSLTAKLRCLWDFFDNCTLVSMIALCGLYFQTYLRRRN